MENVVRCCSISWIFFASIIASFVTVSMAANPPNDSVIASLPPEFKFHKIEFPPWSSLPKADDPLNRLQNAEKRFNNTVQGPESIAFDPQGRGPYTGVLDGRIIFWNGTVWSDFAYTSPNRSKQCNGSAQTEHICGRPLGIRFDKRTGDLYIADAYYGLLKVGPQGGLATPLVNQVGGVPFKFLNDLDVDSNGVVYFTQSSMVYDRRNFPYILQSGDPSGRVLKYDPATQKTTILMKNLQFPNGLTLNKNQSFFLVCETVIGRLKRYWLTGSKAGTTDTFALLPGHPDNVRTNEKGEFWVALPGRRSVYRYIMGLYPDFRKASFSEPISARDQDDAYEGGRRGATIVKYSAEGDLIDILEDEDGKVLQLVSEVEERDGKLWMGSFRDSFIGVYSLT